jgi:hypothetical protein
MEKKHREREEIKKKQQKKRKVESIKNQIISQIESCDFDDE